MRICVRPDHLFLGTVAENQADMASKARSTWGESSVHAKLTADDVRAIRGLYADGVKQSDIAASFSITRPNVSLIVNRKTWAHLVG